MMEIDNSVLTYVVATFYNITPIEEKIIKLNGYDDKNYLVTDISDNQRYVLKIIDERLSSAALTDIIDQVSDGAHEQGGKELRVPRLIKTSAGRLSARQVSIRQRRLVDGETTLTSCSVKLFEYFDGIWIKELFSSKQSAEKDLTREKLYPRLGHLCAELSMYLKTENQLTEKLAYVRGDKFPWRLMNADQVVSKLAERLFPDPSSQRRLLVDKTLDQFKEIKDKLEALPQFILHGDLSLQNLLFREKDKTICLIDFQDLQVGPLVVELAILMLYASMEHGDIDHGVALKSLPSYVLAGYQKSVDRPLPSEELLYIPVLMRLRLCQSLLNGLVAAQADPANTYVMSTNKNGWQMLEALLDVDSQDLVRTWLSYVS